MLTEEKREKRASASSKRKMEDGGCCQCVEGIDTKQKECHSEENCYHAQDVEWIEFLLHTIKTYIHSI